MLLIISLAPLLAAPQEITDLTFDEVVSHSHPIMEIASNSDSDRFFSVDMMGVVTEWDVASGEALASSEKHLLGDERVIGSVFHLSVGEKTIVRTGPGPVPSFETIDLVSGKAYSGMGSSLGSRDMSDMNATKSVLADPKDRWVWVGAEHGMARLMTGKGSGWSQRGIKNGGSTALAMDPKAKEIAVGGQDGTVRFIGNSSCDVDEKDVFEGHTEPICSVLWHPKGKLVASASGTDKILLHNRRNGKIDSTLQVEGASFQCLAFHPKGKWLAAGTKDGRVFVWELKKGELVAASAETRKRRPIRTLVVWDKGDRLLAASGKGVLGYDTSDVTK